MPSHPNQESRQDSFEQHLERMRIFRQSHDPEDPPAPGTPPRIKPASEAHKLLSPLLIIGYILNLVHERGAVLLPRNWQN